MEGRRRSRSNSAIQLKRAGLDVAFLAGTGPLDERLVANGIECHVAGDHDILSDPDRLRAASRGVWNVRAAHLLSQCIDARKSRSTIVHAHGWSKSLSPSIGPVLTGSKAAHVYTLHEYFLACPNGGFFNYRSGEICRKRALGLDCLTSRCDVRNDLHKAWRVARQLVLRTAGRLPRDLREIIYLSAEQKSIMAPYISSEARWHHLPNPVSKKPAARVTAEENETFLFVGRLSPEKGAEVAARAAKIAAVPIAFCGDGPSRELVRRANPDAAMPGWVGSEELSRWLRRARCIVFSSLWYECYPLVVADALALGIPIIVSKSCVAASMIEHGVSGLHAETGDVQAWADAMNSLRSNERVERMSRAAFAAGQNLLSPDEYTARLIRIYEAVMARKQEGVQLNARVHASC